MTKSIVNLEMTELVIKSAHQKICI